MHRQSQNWSGVQYPLKGSLLQIVCYHGYQERLKDIHRFGKEDAFLKKNIFIIIIIIKTRELELFFLN